MRVTTLSCRFASVKGNSVDATSDSSIAVTGTVAVSAFPLYPAIAPAPTVKVRVPSASMLPAYSSSIVTSVSLARSTPKKLSKVTPSMPDTIRALSIVKLDRS